MRVVWIKVGGLWPLNTGGRQRTFHILSELSRRHDVTLLTTHGPSDDPAGLAAQLSRCRVASVPHQVPKYGSAGFVRALAESWASPYPVDLWKWRVPAVRQALADRLANDAPDVIVSDFLVAEPNLPRRRPAPVVFFEHNVEYLIWQRLARVEKNPARRMILALEWRKMRAAETRAVRRATRTVAVSEVDCDLLRELEPDAALDVVPTGVDIEYFRPLGTPTVRHRLVFSGSMDWYPNEDAMLDFVDRMWPRLREAVPDVSLTIVGRNPSARLREVVATTRGITITGTVPDVRPHVDEAELVIVPLRVGGGTRLKIFEALAMGKTVVSTTVGAEGLAIEPGRHYVAADGPDVFTRAIVDLFADSERRQTIGNDGRRLVEARYAWPQVARQFESFLEEAVRGREVAQSCATRGVAVPSR